MASIQTRQRKDGTTAWRVLYRRDGKQCVETFDTAVGADAFVKAVARHGASAALALLEARETSRRPDHTVADQVREHIDALTDVTDGTRELYRREARDIASQPIGAVPIDRLDRETVEHWIGWLSRERHLAPASIDRRLIVLSAAMRRALIKGTITRNPCLGVNPPKPTQVEETPFIEPGDFAVLIAHTPPHYMPLLVFLYGSGARFGEATALQIRDLDFTGDTATVRIRRTWKRGPGRPTLGPPKTRHGVRTVALPIEVVREVLPLIAGRAPSEFVFTTTRGNPIEGATFRKRIWRPIVAQVEPIIGKHPTVHSLRHAHASNMIRSGMDLTELQQRLGHHSIQVTSDLYGHLPRHHHAAAAQAASLSLAEAMPELES